ncbi:hypothetical protein CLF_107260 [Clonorchis sinensis]|uniref:Uncharacterized protein n=1 Tax=Clonorchis sinensis TaxID=79923 RepID=H2KRV9_CLOSI|nr:hypothetical protein CLF_107260 [Clonorchis sinensis]
MDERVNRNHGATMHSFSEGQKVVRDYRSTHPTWIPEHILRRRGRVLYKIQVGPARPSELSLKMLLDPFDLSTIPENQPAAPLEAQPEHALGPRRWTDRIRKPVRPLQLNRRLRSYVNKLQGGVKRNSTVIPLAVMHCYGPEAYPAQDWPKVWASCGSQGEIRLVESLNPTAHHGPVFAKCRLPMSYIKKDHLRIKTARFRSMRLSADKIEWEIVTRQ